MLAYCDYIADRIKKALTLDTSSFESHIAKVGNVKWDLTPEGAFASTKKTLEVADKAGKLYRVTVEEVL